MLFRSEYERGVFIETALCVAFGFTAGFVIVIGGVWLLL